MSIDSHAVITADSTGISMAVDALRAGGLVGFPTETVYGLAARATDSAAVGRIFETKGRPADHPLIVHIAQAAQVDSWARDVPSYARELMRLWPGPLTLILPRRESVDPILTGGQDTIGLRIPAHPAALAVLTLLDDAVAAPSANVFGSVSPTCAEHVFVGLGPAMRPGDVILDAGPCQVGIESTIVDCTGGRPRILRPGAVSAETVEAVSGIPIETNVHDAPRVSGSLASHYAPTARVLLVEDTVALSSTQIRELVGEQVALENIGFIGLSKRELPEGVVVLLSAETADEYARGLYTALRHADELGLSAVVAVQPPAIGVGIAIRDRLMRAAAGR